MESLFNFLHRKEYMDLLINLQDRELYAIDKLSVLFDDDDLEYIYEDNHNNIIEIRHRKRYRRNFGHMIKSSRAIVKHFKLFSKLHRLNLSSSRLSGKLSFLPEMSISLLVLNLSCNHINGEIPCLPPNLEIIDLSRNHITGGIENCMVPNLKMLYLNNNLLSGPLPSFNDVPNIARVALHNNFFSGLLPDFSECSGLGVVMLHAGNHFHGCINYILPNSLLWIHLYETKLDSYHIQKLQTLNPLCHVLK